MGARKAAERVVFVSLLQACNNHFCVWSLFAGEGESRREHRSMWVHLLCLNQTTFFKIFSFCCYCLIHFVFTIAGRILPGSNLNLIFSRKTWPCSQLWIRHLMRISVINTSYYCISFIVLQLSEQWLCILILKSFQWSVRAKVCQNVVEVAGISLFILLHLTPSERKR